MRMGTSCSGVNRVRARARRLLIFSRARARARESCWEEESFSGDCYKAVAGDEFASSGFFGTRGVCVCASSVVVVYEGREIEGKVEEFYLCYGFWKGGRG